MQNGLPFFNAEDSAAKDSSAGDSVLQTGEMCIRDSHTDMLLKHGDQAIVANGGWHDAGDLAQGLVNTIEATAALLDLAEALKTDGSNDRLYRRVLEEAKWGLDYVLKMRFGDGHRGTYTCLLYTSRCV